MAAHWTANDIPNLDGQTALVTGANSGLGYWSSYFLASKGAKVIMACRNQEKGQAAKAKILKAFPQAQLDLRALDLSDLGAITNFSQEITQNYHHIDILLNNAGVMFLPQQTTKDGFEIHFGTNHLGHFSLTGQLLPLVIKAPNSRIVTVSSMAHRRGKMNFDDLHFKNKHQNLAIYCQSKLANLLFAFELQRKLESAGHHHVMSLAAHPGYSDTNLAYAGPEQEKSKLKAIGIKISNSLLSQPAEMGTLPQLYAATSPEAQGGKYYGPHRLKGVKGFPIEETPRPQALNESDAQKLWDISKDLTGIPFNF